MSKQMRIRLDKLGDFKNGANFSLGAYGTGFPIVNVKQLYSGRYVTTDSLLKVSASAIPNPKSLFLIRGDILFARSSVKASGAGQVAMIDACPADTVFSGFIIRFRISAVDKALPEYLNYVLRSPEYREVLTRMGTGTTITNLSQTVLGGLEVDLPCLSEQRTIAAILGALDDKIELNRRMNETLEAIARALFKSWFVDFDPVRVKAEGQDPGLPRPIADLFPARLVDSELGEIPEGWEVGSLERVAELVRVQTNPFEKPDRVFSHCSIPAFDNGQLPVSEFGAAIKSMKFWVPAGTVLFSKLNPTIERVWLIDPEPDESAICSTEFLVLCPKAPFGRCFLYCLLRSPNFREAVNSLATGTSNSHQRARADRILQIPITVTLAGLAERFEDLAGPPLDRTLRNRRQSQTLANIKDALLPKLISGELRVKEAERVVAEAAACVFS